MTSARYRWALAIVVAAAALATVAARPVSVAAAEYTMVTEAAYLVDPDAAKVGVTVGIVFTNTFPAPAGQVSVYREIRLAIHDHAAAVAARDASGPLTVTVAASGGVNVATVKLRTPVAYGKSASLTLTYELRDGDDPSIRVGTHLVSFPAWGFGTRSHVTVTLPADFEVRVGGDAMAVDVEGDSTVLDSGQITDPAHWLAHVGATRAPMYDTLQEAVPMAGGTADVIVRHWSDDPEWGTATMDLLVRALPLLETTFGLPYPAQRPLVVTESVTGGNPDQPAADGEVAVGFAEPPFTLLHQVAHLWTDDLAGDRWLGEGLASWAAADVSTQLEIELPYDPQAVAKQLSGEAFPLAEWSADGAPSEATSWAYAESWSLTNDAVEMLGADAFRTTLQRMAAGLDGYEPLTTIPDQASASPANVTSREYLDHLDALTENAVVEALAGPVLGNGADDELAARTAARTTYATLLVKAGDWGDPDPVRSAMVGWTFDVAQTEMEAASSWLDERDVLLAEIAAAGLTAPDRLESAYRTHGGGDDAWAEIEAERAVVEAYVSVSAEVAAGLNPIEQVGMAFGPSPEDRLAAAATAFAAGDLRDAADRLAQLDEDLATASAAGLLRIVGLIVALGAAAVLIAVAIRRRRSTDYTRPS